MAPNPFVEELGKITDSERQRDYGHPLFNFLRIALHWNAYLGERAGGMVLTPVDVALMNVGQKIARLQNTFKDDSVLDIAGYAKCVADMDAKMVELGYVDGVNAFRTMSVYDMQNLLAGGHDEDPI